MPGWWLFMALAKGCLGAWSVASRTDIALQLGSWWMRSGRKPNQGPGTEKWRIICDESDDICAKGTTGPASTGIDDISVCQSKPPAQTLGRLMIREGYMAPCHLQDRMAMIVLNGNLMILVDLVF